ncbi:MAG: leucine--tRNA ligase [Thaumarchaeota archaeon]|nr:leucine--tRNA ligase [Nitrososphaerota archaeon]
MMIDWRALEEKWRKCWFEQRIFEANPDPNRPKFYITVAYPYPNSPQHIGHGRTYTLADVHARYRRMQGYNTLLPMGFHYTGTPILAMSKRIASGDEGLIDTFRSIYKVPEEKIKEFKEPLAIAKFFHQEIKSGMIDMGFSIDWRREFTTIDPHYSRFIEWQFKKLKDLGFIKQGSHPVGWCPVDGNPVGQHDTLDDVEPEIGEFTLIKFMGDGRVFPTATLRPETVFGVTNLWLNPSATYVEAEVDGEAWVVSREAAEKLRYLNRKVEVKKTLEARKIIGANVVNPLTGASVPILPASFVDPKAGTGVVMSVPAHAPYDYQALEDLKADKETLRSYGLEGIVPNLEAIKLIESEGYSGIPALEALRRFNVKDQNDPKLDEATTSLYAHEFHSGRMMSNTGPYSGLPVSEARVRVKEDMLSRGIADKMYELMNRPVKCRCGAECVVKIFENQWFIDYSNAEWKRLAKEAASSMTFYPEDIRAEFEYTIDWLREKACARKSGLGTPLPWDKGWIIESLSDSVIYMAYYTIAHLIRKIDPSRLKEEFFDYIFLGRGEAEEVAKICGVDTSLIEEIRREFTYFYPLDARHSGRDLVPNHLTFFIFNHAAIFPRNLWPRSIVVNGSVLMEGKKMSKSYGNIIPLREAVSKYCADALRLALLATAELLQDADISLGLIRHFQERLEKLYTLTEEVLTLPREGEPTYTTADRWLMSRLQEVVRKTTEAMEKLRVREAIHNIVYVMDQDVAKYQKMKEVLNKGELAAKATVLRQALHAKVRMLAPFAPYLCEELWHKIGGEGFVCSAQWPKCDESKIDLAALASVELIDTLLEDTQNITQATGIKPRKVFYYTAASWKRRAYLKALEQKIGAGLDLKGLIKDVMQSEPNIDPKKVSDFAKKVVNDLTSTPLDVAKRRFAVGLLDENLVLKEFSNYLAKEIGADIFVFSEDDHSRYDPKNRAELAKPYRPAIYLE